MTEERKLYGDDLYKNVLLSDSEHAKLKQLYGDHLQLAIEILNCYIENSTRGKKYKSHYTVLRKRTGWLKKRVERTLYREWAIKVHEELQKPPFARKWIEQPKLNF